MTDLNDLNDLNLPARRPMPPEVRDRLRTRVLRGLTPPRTRFERARPPLAVAASVAVLAAGAAIVAQSVSGPGDDNPVAPPSTRPGFEQPPQPPPLDPIAAAANMDRCWTAAKNANKAAAIPDRATWQAVFEVTNGGRTVTAARADGRPLFCETTLTTVTVSDPSVAPTYAKGSRTAAMLITKDGAAGGVVDPSWQSMVFGAVSPGGASSGALSMVKDGMFVDFSMFSTGPGSRFTVRQTEPDERFSPESRFPAGGVSTQPKPGEPAPGDSHAELDLPLPPAPIVSSTDRPAGDVDRSSDAGRFLGECIAKSDVAVIDPESWQPVVIGGAAPNRQVLARSAGRVGACRTSMAYRDQNDPIQGSLDYQFFLTPPETIRLEDPIQYRAPPLALGTQDQQLLLGLLREDVTAVELFGPGGSPVPVILSNGAFSATVSGVDWSNQPAITAVVRDAAGKELYRGPVGF